MEQKEHQFFGYLNFLPAFKHGTIERRKYQVWTCKLRINAYLLEFWMSEAPVSGHGRWVNTANWEAGEGLIFETLLTQTELNDFGASSQAKLTPSARFISSVRHGLDLTTL
ncbi:16504_t:CDS:2, partial [Rhizophagus irregularis]